MEVLFLMDVIISFYTPYWDSKTNTFETKFNKIALNYLSGYFSIDVVASMPVNIIILLYTGHINSTATDSFKALKPLKALRSLRVL